MNRAKWRDTAQNIIITLLALSAVLLFSQTQFFHLSSAGGRGYFDAVPSGTGSSVSAEGDDALSMPLRLAISDEFSHSGSVALTTDDEAFLSLKSLLQEALGSSHTPVPSSRETFMTALQYPSIFCDFLHALPLSYLAEHFGTSAAFESSVRYLLISQQQNMIFLFLWDGTNPVLRCATALQSGSLPFASEQYSFGSIFFSSELEYAQHLSPCDFFPETLPALDALTSTTPVQNTDALLSAFQFNPHTNSRYTESGGTEVIMDGDRSLRIQPNGTVTYHGGNQSPVRIAAGSASPTIQDAATSACALLYQISPMGDGRLYVDSAEQHGTAIQLTFGCEIQGVPICLSEFSHTAVIQLNGNTVTDLTFSPRQYMQTESAAHLLPLQQAIAVASAKGSSSLYIGYADRGNEQVSPTWLAD